MPSLFISASGRDPSLGVTDVLGIVFYVSGFFLESAADLQKYFFKKNPVNRGRFISTGVWSLCRYPNYFGEILLWWGIFCVAAKSLHEVDYISVVSPLFVMLLLLGVSGIPIQEAQAKTRWGEDPDYQAYRHKTPLLVPFLRCWK